ncbi:hypothetical protein MKW92_009692 [Papaver armeniacum]|nr:hypothetical protein MKW92_009692 [Papaver armeniacum]
MLLPEKPHFFVRIVWVDLLLQWPRCIANVYGIVNKKSWVKKTCLIYDVSIATGMVAILSELIRSGKEDSSKVGGIYAPLLAFAILKRLRTTESSTVNLATTPPMGRKKRLNSLDLCISWIVNVRYYSLFIPVVFISL